jgi:hypothetical protein
VDILKGLEHLEAPSREEAEVLSIFGDPLDPPTCRLACSAVLRAGPGLVRIAIAR